MYKKNKMLSAIAAVAILSSGAMSFDMQLNSNDTNGAMSIITDIKNPINASYIDTNIVTANKAMKLSINDRGDALIYPAFRAKDGWETKITVRNTRDVSVVAKAVLYDAYDSHELKDFNLYLSSHDVGTFKIKENNDKTAVLVTTRDGSIMAGLDDTLETPIAEPVKYDSDGNFITQNVEANLDGDPKKGDFIISSIPKENFNNDSNNSGYVIVYVMAQTDNDKNKTNGTIDYYHNDHKGLYQAYYNALTKCRGADWKKIFSVYGSAQNGTATGFNIIAPNVDQSCDDDNSKYPTHFVSPDKDILFGEVSISRGDSDPRSLLLKARAIENYTDDSVSQMMLWAPGEYASIQDRRIIKDPNGSGYAKYDTDGIAKDAEDMVVTHGYFSFNKHKTKNDRSVLLVTQPMKRALVMADKGNIYWNKINKYSNWGEFSLKMKFYDEDENADRKGMKLVTITSPANAKEGKLYRPEMAPLTYDLLAGKANQEDFKLNKVNGYADIIINTENGKAGLPAIVTEMVSEDINGEAQINWIYSATNK